VSLSCLSCLGHCPAVGHCRVCVSVLLGSLSGGGSLSCVCPCAAYPAWVTVQRWVTVVCVSLSCLGHCPAVGHCRACVPVLPVLLGSLSSGGSLSCVCAICPEWLIVVRVSLSCLGHTVLFGLLTCVCVTVGRAWVTVLSCLDHCPEWGALFCRAWTSHC